MKRRRISTALAGVAGSCAGGAALRPQAGEAGVLLSSREDPVMVADAGINSALRNNRTIVADNIEQALARGDADLANSFVALARDKNVAVSDDILRRVAAAVAEENSTSHLAKRFAAGF